MATAIKLIGTGIAMGVVHVLTGPDHMSALATLSSSSSSSPEGVPVSKCYLFGLGARWGIGHSTGLLLVGGIFVLRDILKNDDDDEASVVTIPDAVTKVFEAFVGVFMLLLGFYGIWEARRNRNNEYKLLDTQDSFGGDEYEDEENPPYTNRSNSPVTPLEIDGTNNDSGSSDGTKNGFPSSSSSNPDDLEEFRHNVQVMFGTVSTFDDDSGTDARNDRGHHHHDHHHHSDHSNSPFLALCAGIFHGLAGPGGVLGVVPAIQLHNAGLAACYLLSFCATSTLTMGTFAAAYGTVTASLASFCASSTVDDGLEGTTTVAIVEFWIRCFSASMSVLVGVVWLVLLAMGKLEEVFG